MGKEDPLPGSMSFTITGLGSVGLPELGTIHAIVRTEIDHAADARESTRIACAVGIDVLEQDGNLGCGGCGQDDRADEQ